MKKLFSSLTMLVASFGVVFMLSQGVSASDSSTAGHDQSNMDHSKMGHDAMEADEADVPAVINSIDADAGVLNVSHEPVEALGWPAMTMDLPVTKRVDLSKLKEGDEVTLTLKQGRDKKYRIVDVK